jgi:holo-[acyl-carrier protein] synthase
VKEAIFKALGTGWSRGVAWKEIETTNAPSGRPQVAVTGRVEALLKEQGGGEIFVTISHDTDYSIGQVIITRTPSFHATPIPRPLPRRGGEGKKITRR